MLNGISLFSGYAGIDLALRDYVRPIIYCEIEKYAQGILISRMDDESIPFAPIWNDVTTLDGTKFRGLVDVIYGGFPCQDISVAGKGAGLDGERSGLFKEIIRLCKEASPQFIFLENVPAIRTRGSVQVQEALASIGYDSRWFTLSASEVGANHKRERWFCLATNTKSINDRSSNTRESNGQVQQPRECFSETDMADSISLGLEKQGSLGYAIGSKESENRERNNTFNDSSNTLPSDDTYSECERFMPWPRKGIQPEIKKAIRSNSDHVCFESEAKRSDWWTVEPDVGGVFLNGASLKLGEEINEPLLSLWKNLGAKTIWEETGRFYYLSKKEILQPFLHGQGSNKGICVEVSDTEENFKIQKEIMRVLQIEGESLYSPHRWKLEEQSFAKFENAMLSLSYIFASHTGRLGKEEAEEALLYLWPGILSVKSMLNPSYTIQKAWESLDSEWKRSLFLSPWNIEPPIDRVCNSKTTPYRVDRIKALGNGVVPLQVKTAFEYLMGIRND